MQTFLLDIFQLPEKSIIGRDAHIRFITAISVHEVKFVDKKWEGAGIVKCFNKLEGHIKRDNLKLCLYVMVKIYLNA